VLILHRDAREATDTVVIGSGPDKVVMKILGYDQDGVKLGFAARRDIDIHRGEVYRKIHPEDPIESRNKTCYNQNGNGRT